ncbi:MAG TPA: DUF6531 domain-containing protein [Pyrinomonadaceae bacterium]|nr:DUF6531 domain-containing protein [Pyrinomonadaceae bacterium]
MKNEPTVVAPHHLSNVQQLSLPASPPFRSALKNFLCVGLIVLGLSATSSLQAQTCENIPQPGSESISAKITINGTGIPVTNGMIIPAWTPLRIDSIATATGSCVERAWTNTQPSSCEPTGTVWERHPNHTQVSVEISSETGDMGWIVGYVYPTGPPYQHVINSESSDTTGPNTMYAAWRGVYKFHIYANINYTICNLAPYQTEEIIITVYVGAEDDAPNFGEGSCPTEIAKTDVGEPINVTNGNMYLQQTDYRLPGFGGGLELTRTYNSRMQRAGFFGYGWSSILDESVVEYGPKLLRLNLEDGRAVYFTRSSTTAPYVPVQPGALRGQVV